MKNQEVLIIFLIILFVIIGFYRMSESFELNNFPCNIHPLNSNCTCPRKASVQSIFGQFPMNYGLNSPYTYTCVPDNTIEPSTNLWPSEN